MQRILPAAAILVALTPLVAGAADVHFPLRRAGLWENTMKSSMGLRSSKTCTSPQVDRALMEHGLEAMRKRGGKAILTGAGSKYHVTTVVDLGGHTMTTDEDVVFTGDAVMHAKGSMHLDPPFQKPMGIPNKDIMLNDGKWVGPCPADMKPGDMEMNGHKINVLTPEPTIDQAMHGTEPRPTPPR